MAVLSHARLCCCVGPILPGRFLRLALRIGVILGILIGFVALYLRHLCLLGGYPGVYGGSCFKKKYFVSDAAESYAHNVPTPPPSVHVVLASTKKERSAGKTNWATQQSIASMMSLPVQNVEVKKYVADDDKAEFHPRLNKGHEVAMYLTYISAHYDSLPDVTIFLHAEEYAWHVEPLLLGSLSYLLSRLDVSQVLSRGFVNLRVAWGDSCPEYNTTTMQDTNKVETPFMRQAWADNFAPRGAAQNKAPDLLATPCCNQFAVTRDTIRRHKKSQYERSLSWLQSTQLDDRVAGRVWEHLFQYLFSGKAIDCPLERKTYCSLYHICLADEDWREFSAVEREDLALRRAVRNVWAVLFSPFWGWEYTGRLAYLGDRMKQLRLKGLISGQDSAVVNSTGDIYTW